MQTYIRLNRGDDWQLATRTHVKAVKRDMLRRIGLRPRTSVTIEHIRSVSKPPRTQNGTYKFLGKSTRSKLGVFLKVSVKKRMQQVRARKRREAKNRARMRMATIFKDRASAKKRAKKAVRGIGRRGRVMRRILDVIQGKKTSVNVHLGGSVSKKDIVKALVSAPLDSKILLEVLSEDGKKVFFTMNNDNKDRLMLLLEDKAEGVYARTSFSDAEIVDVFVKENVSVRIINVEKSIKGRTLKSGKRKTKNAGAFFKYYVHETFKMDLYKYGIFDGKEDTKLYGENCLVRALRMGGCSSEKINQVKLFCRNRLIPVSKLSKLCATCNISIWLQKATGSTKDGQRKKIGTSTDKYEIALVDGHFFFNEKVDVTSYAIKNYDAVKHHPKWNKIFKKAKGKFRTSNQRQISSFKLVKLLLEHKDSLLLPIGYSKHMMGTQFHDKVKHVDSLFYEDECTEEINEEGKEEELPLFKKKKVLKTFIDFESTTTGAKHRAYLCALTNKYGSKVFCGWDCATKMLSHLQKEYPRFDHLLIAHNMKYDSRFLIKHLQMKSYLVNGPAFITAKGRFEQIDVTLKCSYRLIAKSLSKFGKMFDLDQEKEVMPYDLYTPESVDKKFMPIKDALKYLKDQGEVQQFQKNLDKWGLRKSDGTFNIVEYSAIYCKIDTQVLAKGYETFRSWILDFNQDIDNVLTCPGIANNFFYKNACYDGCHKLSNTPRHFIQQCVVGGKTMCAWGKKNKPDPSLGLIADFDGVSLYPSAMLRLARQTGGYLLGRPKVIPDDKCNIEWLSKQDGYFVEAVVTKVTKNRAFPLLSYKDKGGTRRFSNQAMVGRTVSIDKITLEDAMHFQGIEFEIKRGYYYDEGRNGKIGDIIQTVFNKRLELKKAKNPIQEDYKLIMNSGYGKMAQKAPGDSVAIVDKDELDNQISLNYNFIKEFHAIDGGQFLLKKYETIDTHFNLVANGVEVLSMAKRIMNEVMCTAEDIGIDIYITDTDSMHLLNEEIPRLQKAFNTKYGRELIGKQLGQFHSDFEMDGCKEVLARKSIFLGKKCYIDELVGINKESGNEQIDYHIRMKGVPTKSIWHKAHKSYGGDVMALYQDLYEGNTVKFDLLCDGQACSFAFDKNMNIKSRKKFMRRVKFL